MGKLYRLIIISIIALIFAIGCSDTNSQSSGGGNITDNGSSGGNGGDGSGGDGSGSSSEIINSTMRASASIDNALLYTFFTPAAATNGASLKYSWDFDDNAVETTDTNIINHEFSKYGKSYNVTLEVSNMQTNDKENVSMIIPLPKPTIYFACSTAGLDIYCLPNISQQGINDVEYTWNIFNSSNEQIASFTTKGSHELATYTMPLSGTYTVTLSGTTPKVDGAMEYTEIVEVNQSLNRGSISHSVLSADKLQYRMRYSAGSTNGDILNYCWEIDEEINSGKCKSDANYHQGTSSTYDEIMHTFPKYKKAYNIKGYVKDASGAKPAVSSAIIYQDLPVVAVSATGTGLSKKFSPVFTYKPAGNLQYVWNFGDGAQSSAESPEHTYQKSGYYTVTLEVISDKFDTLIGSIKSNDVNININENINNVVIESSLKSRDKSGEKHIISSPAQSTQGALYYIWKVDGNIAAEGENIHTLEYSFPVFGKSYSVSLEVEDKTTGIKVIAEPKVIATKKPVAEIVLPPYSTPNTQVQIQAKVYFEDTGEDFILMANNPTYEWYINNQNENQNKPSIDKMFTQTQQVPVKLNISADNIEGSLLTAESTIYINNLNLECSIADDAEDIYGAIVTCSIPTDIEGSTAYYYKFTYTEYMNGVPVAVEVPATEKTQFKIKLYEEGSPRRYQDRTISFQWYAGTKGQYQYSGNINFDYTAKEPIMDRVVDVIIARSDLSRSYILTEKGNVYYTNINQDGNLESQYSKTNPRYMYIFNEPIRKIIYKNYPGYIYFQSESGHIYRYTEEDMLWNEELEIQQLQGVTGILEYVIVKNNIHYIVTDNGVYLLGHYGDGSKVLNKKILGVIDYLEYIPAKLLAEDGQLYAISSDYGQLKEELPGVNFKIIADKEREFHNNYYSNYYSSKNTRYYLVSENNEIYFIENYYSGGYHMRAKVDGLLDAVIEISDFSGNNYIINNKLYSLKTNSYEDGVFNKDYIDNAIKDFETKSIRTLRIRNSSYDTLEEIVFLVTPNNELYVYADKVKYGFTGLGHVNPVLTPQKIEGLSGVKDIKIIAKNSNFLEYGFYGEYGEIEKIIVETENGTYEWGMDDGQGGIVKTPIKAKEDYEVLDINEDIMLTDKGCYLRKDGSLMDEIVVEATAKNNRIYTLDNYNHSYKHYINVNGRLYTLNKQSNTATFVNKEYFDSIVQQ